jgi:hypothetical protein
VVQRLSLLEEGFQVWLRQELRLLRYRPTSKQPPIKSRSKTAGQKMPWRQDGKIKFKKRSPGNLHSSAVVMEYYEWLE